MLVVLSKLCINRYACGQVILLIVLIIRRKKLKSVRMKCHLEINYNIQGGPKMASFLYILYFHQILTDFQNFFTISIRRQFVIKLSL